MNDSEKHARPSSVTARLIERIILMPESERQELLASLEEKQFADKRKHDRKKYAAVVDYAAEGRNYKDFIQDIGQGGVFIRTRVPFGLGQEISLTFPLPGNRHHMKIMGRVVRTTDDGIGVAFKVDDEDQLEAMESLLENL
jgi:Tfp pilus assembly protein PilZ